MMKVDTIHKKAFLLLVAFFVILIALIIEFILYEESIDDDFAYDIIIDGKQELLKGHVDRTIYEIEQTQSNMLIQYDHYSVEVLDDLNDLIGRDGIDDLDLVIPRGMTLEEEDITHIDYFEVLVGDLLTNQVVYSSEGLTNYSLFDQKFESYPVYKRLENQAYSLSVYMTQDSFVTLVKESMYDWISDLRLEGSDYLWVNEIVNYQGGQDYAIRFVHPNLPDTEGIFLSTETQDIAGNKPYKEELEGINAYGEVYFTYYFKEYDSSDISQKMTYAKLYQPFDWVIATGVYMNDILELKSIDAYNERRRQMQRAIFITSALGFIILGTYSWRVIRRGQDKLVEENVHHKETAEVMLKKLDRMEDLAYRDYLTGLHNRRGILERLKEELLRCQRQNYPMAVVMLDVDYFKNINDTYGHDYGDEALKKVADVIQAGIRSDDVVGRIGGDEFLIVLPYAKAEDVVHLVEMIQEALRANVDVKTKDVLTLSIGITEVIESDTLDTIIKRADIAMYQSKRGGRNRMTTF